jgi:Arc/MetJ family transcription regulator
MPMCARRRRDLPLLPATVSDIYVESVAYTPRMKRVQIYIDDESDEILTRQSRRQKRSKAALIRDAVRQTYGGSGGADALEAWAGGIDERPGDIDELIYRR